MSELNDYLPTAQDNGIGKTSCDEAVAKTRSDLKEWPQELMEKYQQQQIPSLYEFLLTQEKLALEIRRQNRELIAQKELLRGIAEASTTVKDSMELFRNDLENVSSSVTSSAFEAGMEKTLMEGMDVLFSLLHGSEEFFKSLEEITPKKRWLVFSWKPAWHVQMENILHGYREGLKTAHQKMIGNLADAEITLIQPANEDLFSPDCHRAIEMVQGGKSRTIHQVIRYGYIKGTTLLRPADVSVYL